MKKLLTLMFTAALAFSLAMPVFAQDAGSQDTTAAPKAEKHHKTKKAHKAKKSKKEKSDETAAPQQ